MRFLTTQKTLIDTMIGGFVTYVTSVQATGCRCLQELSFNFFFLHSCIVPMGFLPWEIRVAFPGESKLRLSRATQPTVHAGCFSVST